MPSIKGNKLIYQSEQRPHHSEKNVRGYEENYFRWTSQVVRKGSSKKRVYQCGKVKIWALQKHEDNAFEQPRQPDQYK